MTIDEAIKHYEDMKKGWYLIDPDELLDFTIDTMRKYQQIENIVDAYITDNPREPMYDTEDYMQSIREVLEDGKV